jgi:bifunctional DNA-binding transcriptional regulator/antitoxin component of YhaV-PrlF toxin-antitoxin module
MTPVGPHPISAKRQVTLPAEVMRAAHLRPGDKVYCEGQERPVGGIVLVPMEIAERWWSLGKRGASAETTDSADQRPEG